jgi:hypothetical protein
MVGLIAVPEATGRPLPPSQWPGFQKRMMTACCRTRHSRETTPSSRRYGAWQVVGNEEYLRNMRYLLCMAPYWRMRTGPQVCVLERQLSQAAAFGMR